MIKVTRFNGEEFFINPDLIQYIERTPDTVITLTNDRKVVVREGVEEIIRRITEFKRRIYLFPLDEDERLEGEV
ncbi:MAG: flagellar FlbD family protein [Clostridiales bacterium]|jgi:flagellar protein FlbD|nr:flagellar FlbD family protein [Clostridiales bacterium]